jgi:hypothetical protein
MTLKDVVENNPVLLALSLLLAGFLSGIASYDAVLRIAHLETVATSEVKELDQTISQLRQEEIDNSKTIAALGFENKNLSYQVDNEKRLLTSASLAQLGGTWINQNPETPGITRFRIENRGDQIFVHAWGKCQPTDCDWGEQRALVDQDAAIVLWDQKFVFRKMVLRLNKRTDLVADYLSLFTDDSGRKKYEKVEVFAYQQDSKSVVSDAPAPTPTSPPIGASGPAQ